MGKNPENMIQIIRIAVISNPFLPRPRLLSAKFHRNPFVTFVDILYTGKHDIHAHTHLQFTAAPPLDDDDDDADDICGKNDGVKRA